MKRTPIALALCGLFLCAGAGAQEPATPPVVILHEHLAQADSARASAEAARASADAWRVWGDELRASLGSMYGPQFASNKVVKGAPYSADVLTENNQPLADGNVISKKTAGRIFRDGEGRTRQETVVDGTPRSIQLFDPVERKSVMLLPGSKKAVTMPNMSFTTKGDVKNLQVVKVNGREIRVENGKVSVDGKEAAGNVEVDAGGKTIRVENGKVTIDGKELKPGAAGTSRHAVVETDTKDGVRRETVRVQVVSSGEEDVGKAFTHHLAPLPPMPPVPPMPPIPVSGEHGKAKAATSSLGSKDFDGVRADGKLVQQTIAAGEIGNRNPILVTTETWYSPELQVTVYSRHNDPRRGETIYKLANIRRAEPAAELFKVPAEYATTKPGTPPARSPG